MVGGFKKDRVSFCLGHILHNHFGYSFPNHSRILPVPFFFFWGGAEKKIHPKFFPKIPKFSGDFIGFFFNGEFFFGEVSFTVGILR